MTRSQHSRATFQHASYVLSLTAWTLTGCYRYVPVSEAAPAPVAGGVRIVLGAKGTLAVSGALGDNVRVIEGSLVRSTSDSLFVRAAQTTLLTGKRVEVFEQPVTIGRTDALSIEARLPDKKRTVLAVALAVGVLIFASVISLGTTGSLDGEPGPPPVSRIPR